MSIHVRRCRKRDFFPDYTDTLHLYSTGLTCSRVIVADEHLLLLFAFHPSGLMRAHYTVVKSIIACDIKLFDRKTKAPAQIPSQNTSHNTLKGKHHIHINH